MTLRWRAFSAAYSLPAQRSDSWPVVGGAPVRATATPTPTSAPTATQDAIAGAAATALTACDGWDNFQNTVSEAAFTVSAQAGKNAISRAASAARLDPTWSILFHALTVAVPAGTTFMELTNKYLSASGGDMQSMPPTDSRTWKTEGDAYEAQKAIINSQCAKATTESRPSP